ncbi:MAG: phosphoglycolate phosphatase [Limnohabitans sp.]|nr:phosphoglycolate phosphatase [Limnohabitans sp.]
MISPKIQAVMIDLDGTMVDTMGDFEAALNLCLADIDLPRVDKKVVNIAVGKGSERLIRTVLRHQLNLPEVKASGMVCDNTTVEQLFEPAFARYQHHYEKVNGKFADVYPGVLPGLQRLQARGLKLACLTNKPTAFAKALLGDKGLAGFFSHVFGGDAFPRKKPDPMPLLETCKALGTLPAQTLMLGDSQNDALAARAAGCPVMLVTYGYNHGEPIQGVDCDGFVDSIAGVTW